MATTPAARTPASYNTDEMTALLNEWARVRGVYALYAAVRLLSATSLPGTKAFARHVDVQTGYAADGTTPLVAAVSDWSALIDDPDIRFTGTDRRWVELAASYADGRPVDLSRAATGLDTRQAQLLAEVVLMATGMSELYAVQPTDKLNRQRAEWDAMLADARPATSPEI
jgi:hypothetical protein